MVNAGAITVAGFLRDIYGERAFESVLGVPRAAGRNLDLDEGVYSSEEMGHRNRAIAHLLVSGAS